MATRVPAPNGARVVHTLPGRTRLKLPRSHRTPRQMATVRDALLSVPGVQHVDINPATGSVLIHHHPEAVTLDDVARTLEEGTDFVLALVPPREREQVRAEASRLAHRLRVHFSIADAWVARATDGWVDLKMLVPLAFLGAAAAQVTLTEGAWTAVPPYVLIYYAYDSFMKFHAFVPLRDTEAHTLQPATGEGAQ